MWTFISALNIQQNVVFVAIHLLVEVNVDYSEGVYVCDITTSDTNQNNKPMSHWQNAWTTYIKEHNRGWVSRNLYPDDKYFVPRYGTHYKAL